MPTAPYFIPKQSLIKGEIYIVKARNFDVAIWDGRVFVGLASDIAGRYLQREFHWDDGEPYGTVKPLERAFPHILFDDACSKTLKVRLENSRKLLKDSGKINTPW